jgi:hypothetical protein
MISGELGPGPLRPFLQLSPITPEATSSIPAIGKLWPSECQPASSSQEPRITVVMELIIVDHLPRAAEPAICEDHNAPGHDCDDPQPQENLEKHPVLLTLHTRTDKRPGTRA